MSENGAQQEQPQSLWLVLALPVSVIVTVFALGFGLLAALALDDEGSGEAIPTETQPSATARGEEVFASQGCGGCHTLSAADATGTVGPSLDETQLSESEIAVVVANGRNQMPAFSASLSEEDIAAVAAYVSTSASAAP